MNRRTVFRLSLVAPLVILGSLAPMVAQSPQTPAGGAAPPVSAVPRAIRRDVPMTNAIRKAFDAGTRDMTGRPGPNYWQLEADYTIQVRLDPPTDTLTGSETILVHNNGPQALDRIMLRLDHNIFRGLVPRGQSVPAENTEGMVVTKLSVNGEAVDLKALYPSSTLLALRGETPRLILEGITRAKGKGESAVYCIYVEEWPGLFNGETPHLPNDEGIRTLRHALQEVRDKDIQIIPIWTISHNAAEAISHAAKELGVDTVLVGATRRSAFYHMLRGHVVKGLMNRLPHNCHLMICN